MRIIILFIFVVSALAQTPTLTISGPATVQPNTKVTLNLTLAGTTEASGLMWTITTPVGTLVPLIGPVAKTAGKTLTSNVNKHILVGLNANKIAPGIVATYTFDVISAASGSIPFVVTAPTAVNAAGTAIPIAAGPSLNLTVATTVLKPGDLNNDAKIDASDLQISVDQILGRVACGSSDLNKDGKCDLSDAQQLINNALTP